MQIHSHFVVFLLVLMSGLPAIGQNRGTLQGDFPSRSQILALFDSREGLLIGQNIGHGNDNLSSAYHRFAVRLQKETGHLPTILGVDYGFDAIPVSQQHTNRILQRFVKTGGVVSISMHPRNPWNRSHVHDLSGGRLTELITEGTEANRHWMQDLARIADGLEELHKAGIVVLWRPFHEMNGGWFWWCPERNGRWPTRQEFVGLWRHAYRYLTIDRELRNLIWVYSPAVPTWGHHQPVDHFYPGDEFVDLAGLDWYTDDLSNLDQHGSYTRLSALGKPLGLTEFGPEEKRNGNFDNRSVLELKRRYPNLQFVLFWHSWPENRMAIIDHRHARQLMQDPLVVKRPLFMD